MDAVRDYLNDVKIDSPTEPDDERVASLGNLIADGAAEMETAPWMLVVPAACLMLVVFCFNFLGDSLRDIGDPELRAVLESLARSMSARSEESQ